MRQIGSRIIRTVAKYPTKIVSCSFRFLIDIAVHENMVYRLGINSEQSAHLWIVMRMSTSLTRPKCQQLTPNKPLYLILVPYSAIHFSCSTEFSYILIEKLNGFGIRGDTAHSLPNLLEVPVDHTAARWAWKIPQR